MTDRPQTRREFIERLGFGAGVFLISCGGPATPVEVSGHYDVKAHKWGFMVDTTKCIGCCACMRACRDENDVPPGYFRTWVERYRIAPDGEVTVDSPQGDDFTYPERTEPVAKAFFVPKLCNQCESSVCSQVCPVGATYESPDGVVLVDPQHCIGCGYCVQACPYGTRFINPKTHTADKCTMCYHRITRGLQPACVEACPTGSRVFGDLADADSPLSRELRRVRVRVLRPELGTRPKCHYVGLDREVI